MRYTSETGYPFDTDNRAYRRFLTVAGEHFHVASWTTRDGRPLMATLRDLRTGDTFSIAILESVEMGDPHALLSVASDGRLSAHGPFAGPAAADAHAAPLAAADPDITATRPVPLHHPDQPVVPDHVWQPLPADLALIAHPDVGDAPTTALILIDHTDGVLAAVGPLRTAAAAHSWATMAGVPTTVTRLAVPLHPVTHAPVLR